ncbi:J domain-containing protein [Bradyrhizobium sp. AUGA SZCCT0169]|uniref:J domain-containing protein n=1 Tax=Bradyrhizobium sp. AUGA SZCCT0169 TaxID=2807663 RepID=UPI001BA83556|nr:J domain-containing protein [Bradyrhizobium sp. AUGA SZCCT0169]MBR1248941.1 J domain-containing protein [Bradyrhizobium sp. AUGA SZCCT0169]
MVPYLWTTAFYLFPAFLVYLLANASWQPRPTLLAMTADQMNATWEAFETNRDRFLQEISAVKDRGERDGIRYLHREDRFEMRSRRGQELNRELEWARSLLSDVQEQIGVARAPEGLRLLTWANALGTWYRGRSFRLALIVALLTCVGVGIVWEVYSYVNKYEPVQALVWNPAPVLIRSGVVFGAQLGWLSGSLTLSFLLRYYQRIAAGNSNDQYLQEAYSSVNDYEEAEEGSGAASDSGTQAIPDPYEILNVSREASIEELKNAYRDAIKRCHPDTVADRSKIIRDAAEAEAQQINSAYEIIRNERGFK